MNCIVMFRIAALAIATCTASIVGGVALGGYTVGGFRMQAPPDNWRESFEWKGESASEPLVIAVAASGPSGPHVCKGCDAGLHRDTWHYASYDGGYDPYAYDAYNDDPDSDGTQAWDESPPTADHVRFARSERTAPAVRDAVTSKGGLHETSVDWTAVMDAYGVNLPVVARAQAQPANATKRPATAPATVAVPAAAVVNIAALEAPAATTIGALSETTVGLRRP